MADISDKEREVLVEFRNEITDLTLNALQQTDHFLIRWLRARDNDLAKAKTMLSNYIEYRKTDDMDNILKWEPEQQMQNLGPYKILGLDSESSPVLVAPLGKWNWRKLSNDFGNSFVRYVDKMYEEVENHMLSLKKPDGQPVTQFVYIIDADKMSLMTLANLQVVEHVMLIAKKFEAFRPETVKKFYVINAGRPFAAVFALIKPILGPRTVEKVQIFGNNAEKYKADLLKDLPASILPPKYGGTNSDAEAVANLDVDEEDEDDAVFLAATVPGGEKLIFNFGVDQGNSTISWAFKTDKYDISFGVTRDGKAYIENKKVDSHVDLQEGTITCDQPGDYIFTFDNTYSRLRNKALSYRIDVKTPSGLKQISFD